MRPLTLDLDDADVARLAQEAARQGSSLEEATRALLRTALDERGRRSKATALVRDASARFGLSEDEGMRFAGEEIRDMRAERRARRP